MGLIQHLQQSVVELTAQLHSVSQRLQDLELSVTSMQPPISEFMGQVRRDCAGMCAEMRATKEVTTSSLTLLSRDYAAQQTKLHTALAGAAELGRRQQQESSAFTRDIRERLGEYQQATNDALATVRIVSGEECQQLGSNMAEVSQRQFRLESDFSSVLQSLEHLKAVALPTSCEDQPWNQPDTTQRRLETLELIVRAQAEASQERLQQLHQISSATMAAVRQASASEQRETTERLEHVSRRVQAPHCPDWLTHDHQHSSARPQSLRRAVCLARRRSAKR